MPEPLRILQIVGARPNFMKVAPIARELARHPQEFSSIILHTGQHYDEEMSEIFFHQLGMPRPHINLQVGSGTHAEQTAAVMVGFEKALAEIQPDLVLVVGDVNSTLACALVAAKQCIQVAHVEAGLRSFDRTMPEEINRVLTDRISDWLFVTEPSAVENLRHEGVDASRIHFVGNVMIDTLLACRERARALQVPQGLGLTPRGYAILTLHRPSNVDQNEVFDQIMRAIHHVAQDVPVVFPVHPRTRRVTLASSRASALIQAGRLQLLNPTGYLQFVGLLDESRAVLTDSGGVQEESTVLGVPCLTLRDNTERPVTITEGTNQLVGTRTDRIVEGWEWIKAAPPESRRPRLWDGEASRRIVDVLLEARRAGMFSRPGAGRAGSLAVSNGAGS
ncbi:MAG TPA: UDP-N-acetylglucosamine 2-epimerase (non-hydrolyzing) [Vicinamibacterales bacterium]